MAKKSKPNPPVTDSPLPVYALFGKDEFLRARRLRLLLSELIGDEDESLMLSTLDGATTSVVDVINECRTPSLMAPRRIVCVRGAEQLFGKDDAKEEKSESPAPRAKSGEKGRRSAPRPLTSREMLEEYITKPCDSGILVLECKTWPSNTRLYKLVEGLGGNLNCDPPATKDYVAWIRGHAREAFGCALPGDAADTLYEIVGEHPGQIHQELAKLATYVAPRKEIRSEEIALLVGEARTEIVFKLMDALSRNDAPRALKQWQQVLANGKGSDFQALGGLRFAFERLVEMKQLQARGASVWDIKKNLRIWDPENTVPKQLERFTLSESRTMLQKLLRIDVNSKTGLGQIEGLVEKLLVEICAAN